MALETTANRREAERFPVNRSVEIASLGDYVDATILDYSEQGVRVSTKGLLNKGERIIVHWGGHRLVGNVVHCCYEQSGTTAGIRLSTGK